jgi:hypothetical protein
MSEVGEKKKRKELRKMLRASEQKLAHANERIETLGKKYSIKKLIVEGLVVIVSISISLAMLVSPAIIGTWNESKIAELSAENARLAQFDSMFREPACSAHVFSGARVVTSNERSGTRADHVHVRGGGRVCLDKDGVVDLPFSLSKTCTCTNSEWEARFVFVYNTTDVDCAEVHIRCFVHADGRILPESCTLRIPGGDPSNGGSFAKLNQAASSTLEKFFGTIWSILGGITNPFIAAFLMLLLSGAASATSSYNTWRSQLDAPTPQASKSNNPKEASCSRAVCSLQEKKDASLEIARKAAVFDIQTNRNVSVAWDVLPKDCVENALASTKKYVCFYRHGELIYMVDSDEHQDNGARHYTIGDLRNESAGRSRSCR